MRKFLLVLLLVLCMAFPAAAETKTWPVTTKNELEEAVAYAQSGDTIVIGAIIPLPADEKGNGLTIPSDQTLTLQISKDCSLAVNGSGSQVSGIYNEGNLTVVGEGSLVVSNDAGPAHGIYVKSGTANIDGGVSINTNTQNVYNAYGVYVSSGKVSIDGGVSINANAPGNNAVAIGVYVSSGTVNIDGGVSISADATTVAYGVQTEGGTANINILSADISASASFKPSVQQTAGILTVYAGKFSDSNAASFLGPDTSWDNATKTATNHASIKFDPTSLDVAQGKSGVVSVEFRASGDVAPRSIDNIEVIPDVDGITVTPSSSDGTITFNVENTCDLGTYTFNVICSAANSGNANKPHMQTETFTVTVIEPKPTPSTGSASNGGCNAGFAGLAIAAFALLAAKRKK